MYSISVSVPVAENDLFNAYPEITSNINIMKNRTAFFQ